MGLFDIFKREKKDIKLRNPGHCPFCGADITEYVMKMKEIAGTVDPSIDFVIPCPSCDTELLCEDLSRR